MQPHCVFSWLKTSSVGVEWGWGPWYHLASKSCFSQSWFHHVKKGIDQAELKERRGSRTAKDIKKYSDEEWIKFLGIFNLEKKSQRNNTGALLQLFQELWCIKRIWFILCIEKTQTMMGIGINTRNKMVIIDKTCCLVVNFLYRERTF